MGVRNTVLLLASVVAALLLASTVTLIVPKERAEAAFPGINGKIVFTRDPDGYGGPKDSEIFTVWFDGNNPNRLTNNTTQERDPAWSPDGKRIAFSNGNDVFVMNADGSDKTLVTDERKIPGEAKAFDYEPAFSPNGRRIAFVRFTNSDYGNIYKIRTDGTNLTYVQEGAYRTQSLSWSPDGTKIVFSDKSDTYEPYEYVFITSPNGSGGRHLITEGRSPDWSPDGSRIIYTHYDYGIYEMDASGASEKPLTADRASDPAFSPGGGKIVFSSDVGGDSDLYIMDPDGTDVRPLTDLPGDEYDPDWQPVQ
jgi:TolB protein